ncbi:MAG TPA: metallophosphoesterase [bacterium]|nr:metallophosphoesterase [bacterium]HNS49427.1 metallophosphoesterase [bacterium]
MIKTCKWTGRLGLVLLLMLAWAAQARADFRFVSLADSRGPSSDTPVNVEVLERIARLVAAEKPALVVFGGDTINGGQKLNEKTIRNEYRIWKEALRPVYEAAIPVYVIPGNHEMKGGRKHQALFREAFASNPDNGPAGSRKTAFSFDHDIARFICLDTADPDTPHRLLPEQTAWLDGQLASSRQTHIFVFGHDPAYPVGPHKGASLDKYPAERDAFWARLVKYRVPAYFCGHEHLYNRSRPEGVYQVINGTCGAPFRKKYAGEFYHYVVVDVSADRISFTVKDDQGKVHDRFEWTRPVPAPAAAK